MNITPGIQPDLLDDVTKIQTFNYFKERGNAFEIIFFELGLGNMALSSMKNSLVILKPGGIFYSPLYGLHSLGYGLPSYEEVKSYILSLGYSDVVMGDRPADEPHYWIKKQKTKSDV